MSHRPERKEKDCLNCGTMVHGRFCHVCGQENVETKETFWSMVTHFFSDITHFDGKFFSTLRILLWRPGFLSAEYVKGRRASYLNPVRMYVFTSAVFFLIFFSLSSTKSMIEVKDDPITRERRVKLVQELRESLASDSSDQNVIKQLELLADTTRALRISDLSPFRTTKGSRSTIGGDYRSLAEYDSIQASKPKGSRDGWLKRLWNRKMLHMGDEFTRNERKAWGTVGSTFLHTLPYLLFVSLPFFALILRLLYIRRKEFYYGDHAILTIHHYVFSFILLLLMFLFGRLKDLSGWMIWDFLIFTSFVTGGVYLYKELRRFYGQGRGKTFVKFILLNLLGGIVLLLLFAVFGIVSLLQI